VRVFDLQGHRGARGLKPENTLPSFEAALDAGVDSIETDVHLALDESPVLCHEPQLHEAFCRAHSWDVFPRLQEHPLISTLTTLQLQAYSSEINVDLKQFPLQNASVTPVAALYAEKRRMHPFAIPLLSDLFAFVESYAGEMGECAGKSKKQRAKAETLQFDLELKRVPFYPQKIGDEFDGCTPALLERCVLKAVETAGVANRVRVRSFDHRCVLAFRAAAPSIRAGVLTRETAPVAPEDMVRAAGADTYCPDYRFLDESLVRRLHDAGIGVFPYTVNDPNDWSKLLSWDVDGITTDYPDRLALFLHREVK
jgi:glycerophosphoryl diester phosphodiesterase